jgi:hypothetical protein
LDQERVEATAGPVITALDKMINQTRGNGGGGVTCSEFSERNSLVSSTDSQQPTIVDKGVYASTKNKKQRKTQIHFASLLGPKCLRLAGVINNNCALVNRRRTQGGIYSNSEDSNDGSAGSEGRGEKQPEVRSEEEGECVRVVGNDQDVLVEDVGDPKPQELDVTVVLPFQQGTQSSSGVDLILCEDSLLDVEGFVSARNNPEAKSQEVQKLLADQQELGFRFNQQQQLPADRMLAMEDRDRGAFANQVSSGPQ